MFSIKMDPEIPDLINPDLSTDTLGPLERCTRQDEHPLQVQREGCCCCIVSWYGDSCGEHAKEGPRICVFMQVGYIKSM